MITVELNEANFEYDIHSLVKAFYPEHDVLVKACTGQIPGSESDSADAVPPGKDASDIFPDSVFHLVIRYEAEKISFSFHKGMLWDASVCRDIFDEKKQDFAQEILPEDTILLRGEVPVDFSDRKTTKNQLKQRLYELLSDFSGKTLPWGTLTGIRPTKIPLGMLEQGKREDEIRAYMKETYFATDEKIDLAIEVAKREQELLSRIDYEDGYSLYVGIPFCPSTCLYCSFTSYPIAVWKRKVDEYLDALEKEIRWTADAFRGKYLNSVYIGGGTPTSLSPEHLERLITMIGEHFGLFDAHGQVIYETNHLFEFTVEAGRPDSITREKLEVLRRHNISRISINPQTMKEETLRLIGRNHTVQQARESFALAREMGFDNINMDLIVGLPGETIDDVRHTMEALMELAPDNVTVHSLAIKRAARLNMNWADYEHLHMENTWETIRLTAEYCHRMGLKPYYLYRQKNMAGNFENVGYDAPGKAGVYNILIMEEKQTIMALGAGATAKVVFDRGERIERVGNVKDVAQYIDRIDEMIDRKKKLMNIASSESA